MTAFDAAMLAGDRADRSVRSASRSNIGPESMSPETRQRQLPSALPGRFIRASDPRFNTSWSGAMASAAADNQARRISSQQISSSAPGARPR